MKYPIPDDSERFEYLPSTNYTKHPQIWPNKPSRSQLNPRMDEYRQRIQQRGRVYRSLPFVEQIYLCNSLSFNALHDDSDIDLFIVTSPGRLRTARLRSVIITTILWLKRRKKSHIRKRLCLSFYVTSDEQNLYHIAVHNDVYLMYWIAHLVPLYSHQKHPKSFGIRTANKWISSYLPHLSEWVNIDIGLDQIHGSTWFQKSIEYLGGRRFGDICERTIKTMRVPIILRKNKTHKKTSHHIIISDTMLKFHDCVRSKISFLFKKTIEK